MLRIGIVGVGYWGPNLVRCLSGLPDCDVTAVCDASPQQREAIVTKFRNLKACAKLDELLAGDTCDAVVVATPTSTHYAIAKQALEAGKHVFVEKPLATSSEECRDLIRLAQEHGRVLFVGHVFLHSAPVKKLRELVRAGELGELRYVSSKRLNLGPVRRDVNALWDLAPHDISVMLDLLDDAPTSVSCNGTWFLNPGVHDVCTLNLHFSDQRMGIIHVSWIDPHKDRMMTVVGSKKMAVFNDLEPLEKIKVYDRGVEAPPTSDFGEFQYSYRYGDMYSPRLNQIEPLTAECRDFVQSIQSGGRPLTDGENGLRVVEVLEAATESLRQGGESVKIAGVRRADDLEPFPPAAETFSRAALK